MTLPGRAFQSLTAVGMKENLQVSFGRMGGEELIFSMVVTSQSGIGYVSEVIVFVDCNEVVGDLIHHDSDGCFPSGL